ncbi:MAG: hypothetical protein ACT4RN_04705, partial [Pseudonocardia sp.]
MIDPQAVLGRRAWVACARCDDGVGCTACRAARTCDRHWRHLLGIEGSQIFVQCPSCDRRGGRGPGGGRGRRGLPGELR